jgi:hypothetical protein
MSNRTLYLCALLTLGGCGPMVDDPGNVPLRGRWQRETKLTALVINDVWVDRKDTPFDLPKDETIVKSCIEPVIRSASAANDELLHSRATRNCKFEAMARKGTTLTSDATCASANEYGGTIGGNMDMEAHEAPDKVDARLSAALFYRTPDGASQRIRMGMLAKWTRLGDCGS